MQPSVDLRQLPRPVASRELYGYGATHRPTGVEAADRLFLAAILRGKLSSCPAYLLPEAS